MDKTVRTITIKPPSDHDFTLNKWYWEEYHKELENLHLKTSKSASICDIKETKRLFNEMESLFSANIQLEGFGDQEKGAKEELYRYKQRAYEERNDILANIGYHLMNCNCKE